MIDPDTMRKALPSIADMRILFAPSRYDLKNGMDALETGIKTIQAQSPADLIDKLPDADVLVVGGGWKNDWLVHAPRLVFVQSISSGTNQYDRVAFQLRGITLTSAQGVNTNAVSDHAMALVLSLARQLPRHHRHQLSGLWHSGPMPHEIMEREDELSGKTMLVIGLGPIGDRIARLARAFGMRVIGIRQDPGKGKGDADEVYGFEQVETVLPRAHAVVLSCPLTDVTRNLINERTLSIMRPDAWLINVARGGCVDEPALIAALGKGRIAGAGLDVAVGEPLAPQSPLWEMPNAIITPHRACETRRYEDNLLAILVHNLKCLHEGRTDVINLVA